MAQLARTVRLGIYGQPNGFTSVITGKPFKESLSLPSIKEMHWQQFRQHGTKTKRQTALLSHGNRYFVQTHCATCIHYSTAGLHCPALRGSFVHVALTNQIWTRHMSSILYVKHVEGSLAIVEVDLDLAARLHNISTLHSNLVARDMDINAYQLASKYNNLKHMREHKNALEEERVAIAKGMKVFVKDAILRATDDLSQDKQLLMERGKMVREELKELNQKYYELEEEIILTALRLPVDRHASTPEDDKTVKELGVKPEFGPDRPARNHIAIGKTTGVLHLNAMSPGSYYLSGDLALLEQDLIYSMSQNLRQKGLQQFSCPDMVKPVILAGCGLAENEEKKVFKLQDGESEGYKGVSSVDGELSHRTLHLTGASPYVFAAFLAKSNVKDTSLPLKAFTVSRNYNAGNLDPSKLKTGLFGAPQSNVVELFGAARTSEECETLYESSIADTWSFYEAWGLPVRMQRVGPRGLDYMEAAKVHVELWSPNLDTYVKVGQVAMWGDFLSRRLMAKYDSQLDNFTNKNYIHTVHGTMVNLSVLLGILLETHQTPDGRYRLPDGLRATLIGKKP